MNSKSLKISFVLFLILALFPVPKASAHDQIQILFEKQSIPLGEEVKVFVEVTDPGDQTTPPSPRVGDQIEFFIVSGHGSFEPSVVITDQNGKATTTFKDGGFAEDIQIKAVDQALGQEVFRTVAIVPNYSVYGIFPSSGGNAGQVTAKILGINLPSGPLETRLVADGQPDIIGTNTVITPPSILNTTFNLKGAQPGPRDLSVEEPSSNQKVTLKDTFTITPGGQGILTSFLGSSSLVRAGRPAYFIAGVMNQGNIDLTNVFSTYSLKPLQQLQTLSLDQSIAQQAELIFFGSFLTGTVAPGIATTSLLGSANMPLNPLGIAEICYFQEQDVQELNDCDDLKNKIEFLKKILELLHREVAILEAVYKKGCIDTPPSDPAQIATCLGLQESMLATQKQIANASAKLQELLLLLSVNCPVSPGPPVPQPPKGPPASQNEICALSSWDPNEKVGVAGVGEKRYVSALMPFLFYTIYFENLAPASAPAQEVVVTDQLDPDLDWTTFSFRSLTIGSKTVDFPANTQSFTKIIDSRPSQNLLIQCAGQINLTTGKVEWRFVSIDPETREPPVDPLAGFLPPNKNPPEGEGSLFYTINAKSNLATDTQIKNSANIVFDNNLPIVTNEWLNTLDNAKPVSQVSPLPAQQNSVNFDVQWSGTDQGSGIRDFSVFISENSGPFEIWLQDTPLTSSVFHVNFEGQSGHTFAFYSLSRDFTGNREVKDPLAEATTMVVHTDNIPPATNAVPSPPPNSNGWNNSNVVVTLTATDNPDGSGVKWIKYSLSGAQTLGLQLVQGDTATVTISAEGTTTLSYFAKDNANNDEQVKTLSIKIDKTAPTISEMPANCTLWPPNHNMVQVSTLTAKDILSGLSPGSFNINSTSNEPPASGNQDIFINHISSDEISIQLRAARAGSGTGRVYTLTAMASDIAGNDITTVSTCRVPHDKGSTKAR